MVVRPIFLFIHCMWLLIIPLCIVGYRLAVAAVAAFRLTLLWNMNCMHKWKASYTRIKKVRYANDFIKRRSSEQMSWIDSTNGKRVHHSFHRVFDYCNLTFGFGNGKKDHVQHSHWIASHSIAFIPSVFLFLCRCKANGSTFSKSAVWFHLINIFTFNAIIPRFSMP